MDNNLINEDYFNFQLELTNIQSYYDFYKKALEITNESENIFIKLKTAILHFFEKISKWIKTFFRKSPNNNHKSTNLNNKKYTFPINIKNPTSIYNEKSIRDLSIYRKWDESVGSVHKFKDLIDHVKEKSVKGLRKFANIHFDIENLSSSSDVDKKILELNNEFDADDKQLNMIKAHTITFFENVQITNEENLKNSLLTVEHTIDLNTDFLRKISQKSIELNNVVNTIQTTIKKIDFDYTNDRETFILINNLFTLIRTQLTNNLNLITKIKTMLEKNLNTYNFVLKMLANC